MKYFLKFMIKVPRKYLPRVEEAIARAATVLGDPLSTPEQHQEIDRALEQIQRDVGFDSISAYRYELRARLGIPRSTMERILERAENVRSLHQLPNRSILLRHLQWWWWRDALAAGTVGIVGLVVASGMRDGDNVHRAAERGRLSQQAMHMSQQLERVNALGSITTTEFQRLRTEVISAAVPRVQTLPALRAAVATRQVHVVFTSSAEPEPHVEHVRPLATVVAALPRAQQAAIIQSYYATDTSSGRSFRSFSVTSGDGTMTVSVTPP